MPRVLVPNCLCPALPTAVPGWLDVFAYILTPLFSCHPSTQGLYGSKHFVRDYLYPEEIEKRHTPVKGAIVIDMLLEYDTSPHSQDTKDLGVSEPFVCFISLF